MIPSIYPVQELVYSKPTIISKSGSRLSYLIDKEADIVKVEFVFNAGKRVQEKTLQAVLVNALLLSGTKDLEAEAIQEFFDTRGAYVQNESTRDEAAIVIFCRSQYLQECVDFMLNVIENATFSQHEIDLKLRMWKEQFLQNKQNVGAVCRANFDKLMFGELHPYCLYPELEDYTNFDRNTLLDFHQKHYLASAFNIYISGNCSENQLESLSETLKPNHVQFEQSFNLVNNESRFIFEGVDNAVQSGLRIGGSAVELAHPDYFNLKITLTLLGGYFGSRLMSNIREEKGYTYGIFASMSNNSLGNYFVIGTEVKGEVTVEAIEEILKEVMRLRTELVPQIELEVVKNYMSGQLLKAFDGSMQVIERQRELDLLSVDFNHYDEYLATIKQVTTEDIQAIAQRYFNLDEMKVSIAGNHNLNVDLLRQLFKI